MQRHSKNWISRRSGDPFDIQLLVLFQHDSQSQILLAFLERVLNLRRGRFAGVWSARLRDDNDTPIERFGVVGESEAQTPVIGPFTVVLGDI